MLEQMLIELNLKTPNKLLKNYAKKNKIPYIEYFDEMKDERNGLPKLYADDEDHPNLNGYKKMEEILMEILKK